MSIKINHLTKIYGQQKALDDVSFEVATGEIVGLLGPNGAGKSTLMKIITGYIPANAGEVEVNDTLIDAEAIDIRHQIGYLPEHNPLYLEMYVREYLSFIAGMYHVPNKKKRVEEMIEKVGLVKESAKRISSLSKGYRQRVGLASALLHDPSVLILDEPTTGLDPNQIIEIRDLIKEVGKEKTVILSTHIMQEVEAICDKVIIINEGKIVAKDSTPNISEQSNNKMVVIELETDSAFKPSVLNSIKEIVEIKSLDNNRYLLQALSDVRDKIFEQAIQSHFKVLSMRKIEKTLEEVFKELTQG